MDEYREEEERYSLLPLERGEEGRDRSWAQIGRGGMVWEWGEKNYVLVVLFIFFIKPPPLSPARREMKGPYEEGGTIDDE